MCELLVYVILISHANPIPWIWSTMSLSGNARWTTLTSKYNKNGNLKQAAVDRKYRKDYR